MRGWGDRRGSGNKGSGIGGRRITDRVYGLRDQGIGWGSRFRYTPPNEHGNPYSPLLEGL